MCGHITRMSLVRQLASTNCVTLSVNQGLSSSLGNLVSGSGPSPLAKLT